MVTHNNCGVWIILIDKDTLRKDLMNLPLEEALTKHNVSFEEAFKVFHKHEKQPYRRRYSPRKPLSRRSVDFYIFKRKGSYKDSYTIRKEVNGKVTIFGTYRSLEDAIKVRNVLMEEGWVQSNVDSICQRLGVERKPHRSRNKRLYS